MNANCSNVSVNLSTPTPVTVHLNTTTAFLMQVLFYVISTFGILVNVFTVLVIGLYKPMHKQLTNMFIANQSIMDCMAVVFLLFTTIFDDYSVKRQPGVLADELLCRLWYSQMPMWSMLISSTYGIVGMTFERFLGVVYPIWHKIHFTRRNVAVIIACNWFIGPLYYLPLSSITSEISPTGICTIYSTMLSPKMHILEGTVHFILNFLAPLTSLSFFYYQMIRVFRQKVGPTVKLPDRGCRNPVSTTIEQVTKNSGGGTLSLAVRIHQRGRVESIDVGGVRTSGAAGPKRYGTEESTSASGSTCIYVINVRDSGPSTARPPHVLTSRRESAFAVRARRNIIKTLSLVACSFVLCWSWSEFTLLLFKLNVITVNFNGTFYNFTFLMVFVSCCTNPVIYCIQYKQFQKGVKWILSRRICSTLKSSVISSYNERAISLHVTSRTG